MAAVGVALWLEAEVDLLSETGQAAAWEPTLTKQLGFGVEVRWVGVRFTVTEG